jgi:integrating conjugative element protein (TIGR03758 family)
MSPAQQLAFLLGSGANSATLLIAIASIVLTLAFVWSMWVTFGAFRAWQDGTASLFDVAWSALRVSIILMVLGFYLR